MKILKKHAVYLVLTSLLASASMAWSAPPQTWTLQDGSSTTGTFVRLSNRHLVIRLNNKEVSIPRETLSPASLDLAKKLDGGTQMDFVPLKAGKIKLGIDKKELSPAEMNIGFVLKDEPRRSASITRPFEIKVTEVTWSEWNKVREFAQEFGYDINCGRAGFEVADEDEKDQHPVTEVSWWDAVKWCNLLSEVEKRKPCYFAAKTFDRKSVLRSGSGGTIHVDWTASGYRLPTEAEWEYAWDSIPRVPGIEEPDGWNVGNSGFNTHPVRTRPSATNKPVHDMLGNVAEWCWDWRGPPSQGNPADPRGPESGTHRTYRGGSWADHWMCCRGTYRGDFSPVPPRSVLIGFRPVRLYSSKLSSR
jgi:formylglycine-generating enzyme required for sulfatase activity